MGEGLREIADQALRLGIVFLGKEADVIAQPQETLEAAAGVVLSAQERQVVGEPERAREEGALAGRQAVDAGRGRVARDEAIADQLALDGRDGPLMRRSLGGRKPTSAIMRRLASSSLPPYDCTKVLRPAS